jgi:hypothetical protein
MNRKKLQTIVPLGFVVVLILGAACLCVVRVRTLL